jgi:hemoglobin-like flavoprotein
MTPEHAQIVKRTWQLVVPIADTAADIFYERLFELDPDLERLFSGVDLASQKKKLLQALAATVANVEAPENLAPTLRALGSRHAGYGVADEHYGTVGRALLLALETGLQDKWSPAVAEAWTAAYGFVAKTMQAGAADAAHNQSQSRYQAA